MVVWRPDKGSKADSVNALALCRHKVESPCLSSLSPRERAVAEQAALGTPLKLIADRLDVSQNAVASYLYRAKKKLMLRSRGTLQKMVVGSPVLPDVRAALSLFLTSAERQVAEAMLAGASNADIAKTRRVSQKTVANQVAAVFHKLHIGSRFELLPRVIIACNENTYGALR